MKNIEIEKAKNTEAMQYDTMLPAVSSVVFNEDCEVGLKRFPDKYFDLAICDIPYGIDVAMCFEQCAKFIASYNKKSKSK